MKKLYIYSIVSTVLFSLLLIGACNSNPTGGGGGNDDNGTDPPDIILPTQQSIRGYWQIFGTEHDQGFSGRSFGGVTMYTHGVDGSRTGYEYSYSVKNDTLYFTSNEYQREDSPYHDPNYGWLPNSPYYDPYYDWTPCTDRYFIETRQHYRISTVDGDTSRLYRIMGDTLFLGNELRYYHERHTPCSDFWKEGEYHTWVYADEPKRVFTSINTFILKMEY